MWALNRSSIAVMKERLEQADAKLATVSSSQEENNQLHIDIAGLEKERDSLTQELEKRESVFEENSVLHVRVAEMKKEQEGLVEKLDWLRTAQEKMESTFISLASQTLQTNNKAFMQQAREQIDGLLRGVKSDWQVQKGELQNLVDPLDKNLIKLEKEIQEMEQKRAGAYQGLEEQLRQLGQANNELQRTAITLSQALKASGTRGRWGELQLRRVVEMSGMINHVDFEEQVSAGDGRPDMIVYLPNQGVLPVDAKSPMDAYLAGTEATDPADRTKFFDAHAKAMRERVRELGRKEYWSHFEHTPEFVVMFIPSEALLNVAFERDGGLLEYAMMQRVLIVSPVNLLALLKTVAFGWQQHQLAENTHSIVEEAKELYNRLNIFSNHLATVGKNLNRTVDAYNKSVGSFERRVIPSTERLRTYGIGQDTLKLPETVEIHSREVHSLPGVTVHPDSEPDAIPPYP